MKAVYIQQHAPIEGLRVTDRPEPWVNPGEVLVHVEAAGINPSDIASAEDDFQELYFRGSSAVTSRGEL